MLDKIRQHFCKHEWEQDYFDWFIPTHKRELFYVCKKCGKIRNNLQASSNSLCR